MNDFLVEACPLRHYPSRSSVGHALDRIFRDKLSLQEAGYLFEGAFDPEPDCHHRSCLCMFPWLTLMTPYLKLTSLCVI
jgi:hypothetical protein